MNLEQYEEWANRGMLRQAESLELIALVRRQESELAAERDTNNRLAAALEQSQASYGALAMELAAVKVVRTGLLEALEHSIKLADRSRDQMLMLGHKVERAPEMQAVYEQCVAAVAAAKEQS